MAAITQIRHRHSDGRAYYEKKLAEGKTHKEALRSLKRRISDAIFARLQADARRAAEASVTGREGNRGTTLHPARPARTPGTGSSDKPLPGPVTTLRPRPATPRPALLMPPRGRPGVNDHRENHSARRTLHRPRRTPAEPLDTKRLSLGSGVALGWCRFGCRR